MKKQIVILGLLLLALTGCGDKRNKAQVIIEEDVLSYSKKIWQGSDKTRKSVEAASEAEKKLELYGGRKIDKWICTKTGSACTTNNKKISYHIDVFRNDLYPDQFIQEKAYEGDNVIFTGSIKRVDANNNIGGVQVWINIDAAADVTVSPK